MRVDIDWPSVEMDGLTEVELKRSDLVKLTRMLDCRSFGKPGLVSHQGEGANRMLVVLTVVEG